LICSLPIAKLNRKQAADTQNQVQPSVPSTAPPDIPVYDEHVDTNIKEKNKKRKIDKADVMHVLEAYDIEVDSLIRRMEVDAEAHASTLRNSLQIELIKIPQKLRKMPIKQFLSGNSHRKSNYLIC
jgi:hypothetical protein